MCGGGGSSTPAPVVPTDNSAEVEAALEKERILARKRKARASTILSDLGSGSNTTSDAGTGTTTLLGS